MQHFWNWIKLISVMCFISTVLLYVSLQILSHLLDGNKKVQQAACSAFATLEEDAGRELEMYLSDIINTFNVALSTYQVRLTHFPLPAII